jgi:hypothetical protein
MSIILYILPTQPPSLIAGYDDFRLLMSEFLGYGDDSSLWTTSQDAELTRRVEEAYRYCLYPSTIPGERIPHVWNFLEQITTLTTVSDDYDYTLPADFGSMFGDFTFALGTGYGPVKRTSEQTIRTSRQYRDRTGRPEHFALRWRTQTSGMNQQQEVLFWPTPDGTYTLTYQYAILPGLLSKKNPYPLGGPRMSQLMIEACKAVGETVKNGQRGDQWNIFREELMATIQMDKGTNSDPTVGFMRDANIGPVRRPVISSVSYYYGPWVGPNNLVDGSYTLEAT